MGFWRKLLDVCIRTGRSSGQGPRVTSDDLVTMLREQNPHAPITVVGEYVPEDVPDSAELAKFARKIVACKTSDDPWENFGLYRKEARIRKLGEQINQKWGFRGMQAVWGLVRSRLGPSATSALTRIWDGVGRWQK